MQSDSTSTRMTIRIGFFQYQSIRFVYASALLISALFGALIFLAILRTADTQQRISDAVRFNAEQRNHMQRATLLVSLLNDSVLARDPAAITSEIADRLALLQEYENRFLTEFPIEDFAPEVTSAYFSATGSLSELIDDFVQAVELFVQDPVQSTDRIDSYEQILALSSVIRDQLTAMISAYTLIQQQQASNLRVLAVVVLAGILLVLVLEGILIFRPMETAINKQYGLLRSEIDQRRSAEIALRRSEVLYRLLAQSLPDTAVMMFDTHLRYTLADGSALGAVGYTRNMIEGKTVRDIIPPISYEGLEHVYRETLQGHAFTTERSFQGRIYLTHLLPVYDEVNQIVGGMVLSQEITARKLAEDAVRTSEERFRSIAENATDLIALLDAEFCFVYANPAYQSMLGYVPAALVGRPIIEMVHPDDTAPILELGTLFVQQQQASAAIACRHLHQDGHHVWVDGRIRFLYGADNQPQGAVVVLRDQTDQRRVQALEVEQERLKTSLAKERELNELKSNMMDRISHEFRTPLTIILSSINLIERYSDRLTVEQVLQKRNAMRLQIRHLTQMLDDINLVVRGDFYPGDMLMMSLDLTKVCKEVIESIESETDQHHRFVLEESGPVTVRGDHASLNRALYEIFYNAVCYSPQIPRITVTVLKDQRKAIVQVSDHGIGILPAELPRLFEPFFRGSNINEVGGLGLGLTIANEIIVAHHGTIQFEQRPEAGTMVTISLPM